jgi:two-component system cell cycle sensor histidine kinase PleC
LPAAASDLLGAAAASAAAGCGVAALAGWVPAQAAIAPLVACAAALAAAWLAARRRAAASERQRRLLLESIEVTPTPFALYDADDLLVAWNSSYQSLHEPVFGTLPRPIRYEDLARAVSRRLLPADQVDAAVAERLASQRQGDGAPRDRQYPGGRWLRISKKRTASGAIVGFAIDITELKRREAELVASEARLRDYAETASDWFWETDAGDRFVFLSARLADGGFDPHGWLGRTRQEVAVDADASDDAWRRHAVTVAALEPFRELTFQAAMRDGTLRYVSLSGRPVRDAAGEFAGYRGVGRDVTAAIQAARQLQEAMRQAELANRSKSQFLANMSHELRTPLNAIIGFSDMMRSGMVEAGDERRYRAYAADILASGRHLLEIINDLLDVAKIEAGKVELREEPVALPEVIGEVVAMLADQAQRAGLTVRCAVDEGVPALRGDRRALRQVLLNLLSNALKFTPSGGTVTIGLDRGETGGLRLSVADTGIGIAAEDLPRLTQPFAQVDGVYQRRQRGTGLGLTLVRALAELHGGQVAIASEPGRGTTVTVELPAGRVLAPVGLPPAVESVSEHCPPTDSRHWQNRSRSQPA